MSEIDKTAIVRPNAVIGTGTTIKMFAMLGTGVRVGNDSYIGPGAYMLHQRPNGESVPSEVGERVFVGAHATICPAVKICNDVVIGAGAVVTKSILEPGTYVGNPAKKIA